MSLFVVVSILGFFFYKAQIQMLYIDWLVFILSILRKLGSGIVTFRRAFINSRGVY